MDEGWVKLSMTVCFKKLKEAEFFYSKCKEEINDVSFHEGAARFLGNYLYTVQFGQGVLSFDWLSEKFAEVFIESRLTENVRAVLQNVFYYEKEAELAIISHQVYDTFKKRLFLYDELNVRYNPFDQLKKHFRQILYEEDVIHYDTLIQFNQKRMDELLLHFVSLCIDDYKQEQEYQTFLHSVREYLRGRTSEIDEIHLFLSKRPRSFTKAGIELPKNTLQEFMEEDALVNLGYLADNLVLAPMIAMNPEKIYIYGADISSVQTIALLNIFEERVILKDTHEFPFSHVVS